MYLASISSTGKIPNSTAIKLTVSTNSSQDVDILIIDNFNRPNTINLSVSEYYS